MKQNCWMYKDCGREEGGKNAELLGVCPACFDKKLDSIHGGKNAGRACWLISGTLCDGDVQGTFAQKQDTCTHCDFYKHVEKEENTEFLIALDLLHLLKD